MEDSDICPDFDIGIVPKDDARDVQQSDTSDSEDKTPVEIDTAEVVDTDDREVDIQEGEDTKTTEERLKQLLKMANLPVKPSSPVS